MCSNYVGRKILDGRVTQACKKINIASLWLSLTACSVAETDDA